MKRSTVIGAGFGPFTTILMLKKSDTIYINKTNINNVI